MLVQGSCPSSDYVCLDDGSCRIGSSDDENIVGDYQEDDTYNYDNNSDYVSNNIETMYDDTLGNDDYESDPVNNNIETMYDDSLGTKQVEDTSSRYGGRAYQWGQWGKWTACSKSCGRGGTKRR